MKSLLAFFFQPKIFSLCVALFSVAALAMALTAEYGFGLKPCVLCLYQRIPFATNAVLGALALLFLTNKNARAGALTLTLAGLVFLANSALAFYHVGVEQHWWVSVLEGCAFDPTKLREAVYEPPVRCDQIPWELFGISMAGYNVIVCALAGVICTWFGISLKRKTTQPSSSSLSQ
ncbi:MAG: disulfide bond formation protein B [Rhodospirillales bacterium]|nr:disulfide bond formation protein B [Rhodospirillales bacterium]MCB9973175.1 disulfide bond formation protein B [Rhodospirillales bacterium]MCB9979568.1 disulfide bond formation protein B [Rhodospirillales bacterium]